MTSIRHHRLRRGILAGLTGVITFPVTAAVGPTAAQAAPLLCTQTIVGPHTGVLNVAGGQLLCLIGATQDGAINVAPDGALSVSLSTITGAVTLVKGFSSLNFCGSTTVRGAISATGGKEAVVVGGSDALGSLLCSTNTIDGAVTLDANQSDVVLGHNHIAGAVTASANQRSTTISGNGIGGALTCVANILAPTNAGVSNTVGGDRSGQTCVSITF